MPSHGHSIPISVAETTKLADLMTPTRDCLSAISHAALAKGYDGSIVVRVPLNELTNECSPILKEHSLNPLQVMKDLAETGVASIFDNHGYVLEFPRSVAIVWNNRLNAPAEFDRRLKKLQRPNVIEGLINWVRSGHYSFGN